MKRYLHTCILADLPRKTVLLMGARQIGKTTLSDQQDTRVMDANLH